MRPIDADTLKKSIERLCEDERTNMTAITYFALHDLLDTMPTVKAEPDNDWFSVKDRMPEQYTDVIVFTKGGTITVDYVDENGDFYYYGEYVTHWMPLPQKPESEDDAE